MSSYFDQKQLEASRLARIAELGGDVDSELHALEDSVVFDCSVCVEFPGCPEDIRLSVALIINRFAVYNQPTNRAPSDCPSPDTSAEHAALIGEMVFELHDVFHRLASVEGFSDHPKTPLRCLASVMEGRREILVACEGRGGVR